MQKIGFLKEIKGEKRVSITSEVCRDLKNLSLSVLIEENAGLNSYISNASYEESGGEIVSQKKLVQESDILVSINLMDKEIISSFREEQIYLGMFQPFSHPKSINLLREKKITTISLDFVARVTRAQSIDVLSSQSSTAGYKAVLLAANHLGRFFPMLTTAAGVITPTKVLILGAGVAGLQAVATAKRLGAVVSVFDVRPEVKEQVQSLGAKFVQVEGASHSSSTGGYAVEQTEEYKKKQKEVITKYVSDSNVVISTALIPGKKAPILITKEMVDKMQAGSVIVDLASSMGGNCELTVHNQIEFSKNQVKIIGPENLAGEVCMDASKMFAKNVFHYIKLLVQEGKINLNLEDEVISSTLITHNGEWKNSRIQESFKKK